MKSIITTLLAYFIISNVWSATITVTNANDSGAGSLREAIVNSANGDEIIFDASLANQTINLTSGEITIDTDLTIDATGVNNIIIDANNNSRIFYIKNFRDVVIKNLTLQNGRATTAVTTDAWGGAITTNNNDINLWLTNITFSHNTSEAGGALNMGGSSTLTIDSCTFDNNDGSLANSLGRGGGAVTVRANTRAEISNSYFINNKGSNGGAINTILSTLTVDNCYFEGNDSSSGPDVGIEGAGGAIFTDGASLHDDPTPGTLSIFNSIFKDNLSHRAGGALFLWTYREQSPNDRTVVENCTFIGNEVLPDVSDDGISIGAGIRMGTNHFKVINCTFTGNKAQRGAGIWGDPESPGEISSCTFHKNTVTQFGGAVFLNAETTITNVTFSQNHTASTGAAIQIGFSNPTINIHNSIIHNNTNGADKEYKKQASGTITGTNNIQYPNPDDGIEVVTGILIADPLLEELADNGGRTQTMALQEGSPAIDAGSGCTERDQRGAARVDACDIGAFEFGGVPDNSGNITPPTPPVEEVPDLKPLNLLTPNGDGRNDTWQIENLSGDYQIRVFTKNGQIVYETNNYNQDWNGLDKNGNPLPAGVYYYSIVVSGNQKPTTGYITIVY